MFPNILYKVLRVCIRMYMCVLLLLLLKINTLIEFIGNIGNKMLNNTII